MHRGVVSEVSEVSEVSDVSKRAPADRGELVLLPSLKASPGEKGGLVLTRKFLNGVAEYQKYWPGRVTTLVELDSTRTSDMDHVEIFPAHDGRVRLDPASPEDGELHLERRPTDATEFARRIERAAVVLAFLSPREADTARLCHDRGVPLVFSSEYSLSTELQIIRATVSNPLRRLRRGAWTKRAEKQRLDALRLARGIQCSGTPTYDVYRRVNENALLFFDNRVAERDVIDEEALAAKSKALLAPRPLRLVFGGRLTAMKGVLDLPKFAHELVRRRVSFTLDIYGSGDLAGRLAHDIASLNLGRVVRLGGVLDFETGWIPLLAREMDLFVCPHPQGDPSSTYPEVMSTGVPIVGYDNEAFRGVVEHSGSGWLVPVHRPDLLADVVARLARHRTEIVDAAGSARAFAREHAFERTFKARVEHLIRASATRTAPDR